MKMQAELMEGLYEQEASSQEDELSAELSSDSAGSLEAEDGEA